MLRQFVHQNIQRRRTKRLEKDEESLQQIKIEVRWSGALIVKLLKMELRKQVQATVERNKLN
jgi:hypothetical protein